MDGLGAARVRGGWRVLALGWFLLLGGCGMVRLPDGTATSMGPQFNAERTALPVNASAPPFNARYHAVDRPVPIRRTYRLFTGEQGTLTYDVTVTPTTGAAKERLFAIVSDYHNEKFQVAIVTEQGRLIGYKEEVLMVECGVSKITLDNLKACSDRSLEKSKKAMGLFESDLNSVNEIGVYFPEYRSRAVPVGGKVGTVRTASDEVLAETFYRGTTTHNGRTGALLDLMRYYGSFREWVMIGYAIIDPETSIPFLTVLSSGSDLRAERVP